MMMLTFLCKKLLLANRVLLLGDSYNSRLLIINISFSSASSKQRNSEINSDLVLSLLRNHGFTNTHISKLLRVRPQLLSSNPQKILLPKIDFFRSIGVSTTDLPRIICSNPILLSRSLENQLIPCYNFLKRVLVLDENVVKMLKRNSRILLHDVEKNIAPNISALTALGVPQSRILFTFFRFPSATHQNHDKFKRSLEEVVKLGFNPLRSTFVQAVQVFVEMTKPTWDRKFEVYRGCGLSDDEIWLAFRAHPLCMNLSEGKIMRGMDFLVNKMGWKAVKIARCPAVLFFNLEKRIIPRCFVIKALMSEGLVKKDLGLSTFLMPAEKNFLDKFVSNYEDNVPGLMNVYLGKTGLLESKFGFEMK